MAITYVTNQEASSTGTVTLVNPAAVAVGDVLVGLLMWQRGVVSSITPTITDNLNTGVWQFDPTLKYYNATLQQEIVVGWIQCDTAGTPTLTAGSLGTAGTAFQVTQFTGFVHSPVLVTADSTVNSGTSATIAANGFTNSAAPELNIAAITFTGGQNIGARTGNFTDMPFRAGDADDFVAYKINTTTGNAVSFGASITSANWSVMLASWQDAVASTAPPPVDSGGHSLISGSKYPVIGMAPLMMMPLGWIIERRRRLAGRRQ